MPLVFQVGKLSTGSEGRGTSSPVQGHRVTEGLGGLWCSFPGVCVLWWVRAGPDWGFPSQLHCLLLCGVG